MIRKYIYLDLIFNTFGYVLAYVPSPSPDDLENEKRKLLKEQEWEIAETLLEGLLALVGLETVMGILKQEGIWLSLLNHIAKGNIGEATTLLLKFLRKLVNPTSPREREVAQRLGRPVIRNAIKKLTGSVILVDLAFFVLAFIVRLRFLHTKHLWEIRDLYENSTNPEKDKIFKSNLGFVPRTGIAFKAGYQLVGISDRWYVEIQGKWYLVKDCAKRLSEDPELIDVNDYNIEEVIDANLKVRLKRELDLKRLEGGR